jgi:hypothetical protein
MDALPAMKGPSPAPTGGGSPRGIAALFGSAYFWSNVRAGCSGRARGCVQAHTHARARWPDSARLQWVIGVVIAYGLNYGIARASISGQVVGFWEVPVRRSHRASVAFRSGGCCRRGPMRSARPPTWTSSPPPS